MWGFCENIQSSIVTDFPIPWSVRYSILFLAMLWLVDSEDSCVSKNLLLSKFKVFWSQSTSYEWRKKGKNKFIDSWLFYNCNSKHCGKNCDVKVVHISLIRKLRAWSSCRISLSLKCSNSSVMVQVGKPLWVVFVHWHVCVRACAY